MRIEGFAAVADVVGRRVKVRWNVVLDDGDALTGVPAITVRRKERDFEFPDPAAVGDDPFTVYDSTEFPPQGATVTEVDLGGVLLPDGSRRTALAESAARTVDGQTVEVLRRTRTTTIDPNGRVLQRSEEVLDVTGTGLGLEPRTSYYYQLAVADGADVPGWPTRRPQAIATPTGSYGIGRALYEQLPAIYRRHDVVTGPGDRAVGAIPEAVPDNGQLRRFLDLFGIGLDHLRGRAESLLDLRDVDTVDARMLPHLAAWLGWNLSVDQPIPIQRHEVRYAAQLYRITGTLPGCTLWAKRLTGWDMQVREMWRNVFVSNDLGNPDDPDDHGSRTADTSDAALLASIGTPDDGCDYSYDTSPDGLHAFTVVAFYATLDPAQTVDDVLARRGRLLNGRNFFLPFNLRPAVVLAVPADDSGQTSAFGLTATTDQGV
jgi:phage tail-like protein